MGQQKAGKVSGKNKQLEEHVATNQVKRKKSHWHEWALKKHRREVESLRSKHGQRIDNLLQTVSTNSEIISE